MVGCRYRIRPHLYLPGFNRGCSILKAMNTACRGAPKIALGVLEHFTTNNGIALAIRQRKAVALNLFAIKTIKAINTTNPELPKHISSQKRILHFGHTTSLVNLSPNSTQFLGMRILNVYYDA